MSDALVPGDTLYRVGRDGRIARRYEIVSLTPIGVRMNIEGGTQKSERWRTVADLPPNWHRDEPGGVVEDLPEQLFQISTRQRDRRRGVRLAKREVIKARTAVEALELYFAAHPRLLRLGKIEQKWEGSASAPAQNTRGTKKKTRVIAIRMRDQPPR